MLNLLKVATILCGLISIACFLLPGASFGGYFFLLLVIYCVMLYFCEKKVKSRYYRGKYLKYFTFFLKFVFILWLISFIIIEGLISFGKKDDDVLADTIIVLGAGVNYDTPSFSLKLRLDKAYKYLVENPNSNVITTGGHSPEDKYSEGYMGYLYLIDKGIDESRVLYEEKSKNTVQNVRYAKELMENDEKTIAVISNGFHLFRARQILEQNGLEALAYGTNLGESYPFLEIIYNIREYFSVLKFYLYDSLIN